MLWGLLEGRRIFEAVDPHGVDKYDDQKHLACITALLGPPPEELLEAGRRTSMFYDGQGLKDPSLIPTHFSFASTLNHIAGEDKKMFVEFVKRMIKWRPEERSTA
ncbi:hypothetical protein VTN77DRAFT_1473 [Rasamsonia byssochlamydoides]|uniref:uncharacterized protein n=1 Tax=Rasamsonia byssochlamydoides TaxID=89139 RepID=UPI0037440B90